MDEDQFNDLKQFMLATVSQATANTATKNDVLSIRQDISNLDKILASRIDDLDIKLDTIADTLNDRLNEHETRITKLEHQVA